MPLKSEHAVEDIRKLGREVWILVAANHSIVGNAR